MSNRTREQQFDLLFTLFEAMNKQQQKLGFKPDDDSEYPRQDRAASQADNVYQFNRERE